MGRRGTKPKPTAILKAQGTYRGDRHETDMTELNGLRLVATDDFPTPPDGMLEDEAYLWNISLGEMKKIHGWVGYIDLFLFRRWCVTAALLNRLDKECSSKPMIVQNTKGDDKINPVYTLRDKTEKTFVKLCTEFGLSPSSRNNISLPTNEKEEESNSYTL